MTQPQPRPVDRTLIDEIRGRNEAAETTLYEQFAARVYYLARKMLGMHDRAEDVRAETFLRVFEAIRQDRLRAPEALPSLPVTIDLGLRVDARMLAYLLALAVVSWVISFVCGSKVRPWTIYVAMSYLPQGCRSG